MTCHEVTLPNGRKAQLGRKGEAVQLYYVQPDGELAYVDVNPLFANNTTIPLHDVGITDAQLFALVQDHQLDLATMRRQEQKEQARFTGFKPRRAELGQAARRNLTGGTLTEGDFEDVTEHESLAFVWRAAGVSQSVAIYVYGSAGREPTCLDPSIPQKCAPQTLPAGRIVDYGEGDLTFPSSPPANIPPGSGMTWPPAPMNMKSALFRQPDGDWVVVYVNTQPSATAGKGLSKQQLIDLVTDPLLDR